MVLFGDVVEFVVDVLELFGNVLELSLLAAPPTQGKGNRRGTKKTTTYNSKMEFHFRDML